MRGVGDRGSGGGGSYYGVIGMATMSVTKYGNVHALLIRSFGHTVDLGPVPEKSIGVVLSITSNGLLANLA